MLFRKTDGLQWVNVNGSTKLSVSQNGATYEVGVQRSSNVVLVTGQGSESAAKATMDRIAGAAQNAANLAQFVKSYDGFKYYNVSESDGLSVGPNGDGTYNVAVMGQGNVSVGHASQAAAIAAADAIAYAIGGVDTALLD